MSRTIVVDIRNSAFPGVMVRPGSYVVWRNLDPFPHSAETERKSDPYFNVDLTGRFGPFAGTRPSNPCDRNAALD